MLSPGDLLQERYRIERPIKAGGMGAVFLAQDTRLDSLCAVKEMHPTEDGWAHRRFREEAQLLSQLHHSNNPCVRDYFVIERPDSLKGAVYAVTHGRYGLRT